VALWTAVIWAVSSGHIGYGWGVVWSTVALYGIFTPLHEASHKSASTMPWVNEVLGRMCGWFYLGDFVGFRTLHLVHHKHTNDPKEDPDMWVAKGPTWAHPLRWMTLDLSYHHAYLVRWPQQPLRYRVEEVVTALGLLALLAGLVWAGWGWQVLWLWIVPLKITFTGLAYSFDYLPHTPHQVTSDEDRYRATLVRPHPLLSVVLLYQNLHLIHHLYPAVPFYRYGRIWRAQREMLLDKGVEVRSLTGQVQHPARGASRVAPGEKIA
jgi:fatty acid desaturase